MDEAGALTSPSAIDGVVGPPRGGSRAVGAGFIASAVEDAFAELVASLSASSGTEPSGTEPSVPEPSVPEPSVPEPSGAEPSVAATSASEPSRTGCGVCSIVLTYPANDAPALCPEQADVSPDGGWAADHTLAAELSSLDPSLHLVTRLADVELADVDDAAVVEIVAGWERVMAWAAARQARAVSELRRRREVQQRSDFVGDELAARMATTRTSGDAKVGLSLQLDRLPSVADALDRGEIDVRKAVVLTDEAMHLPDALAQEVTTALLGDATLLTAPQLRSKLRRLELRRDPDAGELRHQRARADRHVTLTPTQDSMAWVAALLPADDAVAVFTTLTALADSAAPDDPRPLDARRADALVDLATRFLDAGGSPDGPFRARHGRRPHLEVTASATSLLGLDEEPAELSGYGPIPAAMARTIAERATWRPLLVDARTGELLARGAKTYRPGAGLAGDVLSRDRTCTFPGCRVAATRCDLDHIVPFDRDQPPQTQTTPANLHSLCRHHHRAKTHGGWQVIRDHDGTTRWQSPSGHPYVRRPTEIGPADDVVPRRHPDRGRPPDRLERGDADPPEGLQPDADPPF